jgi:uncharacterized membrane protein YkvA (DUF1232 family)
MNGKLRNLTGNANFLDGITKHVKLIARLMADGRVHPLIKLLPIGTLVYLLVPTDFLPLLPFDDAAVIWLGTTLFVEMCPSEIVREHKHALESAGEVDKTTASPTEGEVIEAEFHETKPS